MSDDGTGLAGRRVLVVEDEWLVASEVTRNLRAAGAVVVGPAANLQAATALIGGGDQLDAALLDINLQGRMVYPIADVLESKGVNFAFVSGYTPDSIPSRYRRYAFHEKPFDPASVVLSLLASDHG